MAYKAIRCLLQQRLDETGLSQQELASILHMSRSQISDYATKRKMMGLETAVSIAAVLSCEVMDLYEWEEIPHSQRKRSKHPDE
ncbi:MAG TPA: helix-turn-helix transcriptional regulator [Chitinophagaceae bacterium]|nr:helix-turn-helix transcriptional regulator [Chitinophagaceae bacterium]